MDKNVCVILQCNEKKNIDYVVHMGLFLLFCPSYSRATAIVVAVSAAPVPFFYSTAAQRQPFGREIALSRCYCIVFDIGHHNRITYLTCSISRKICFCVWWLIHMVNFVGRHWCIGRYFTLVFRRASTNQMTL